YVDLAASDVDALDQGRNDSTLAGSRQLGPDLANFRSSRHEPALRWGIGKPCRLIDAGRIEKPLAHAARDELLDLSSWNAQPGGPLAPIAGDQRAGDIVAVARAFLDGVGRGHAVAVGIEQDPREQARRPTSRAGAALGGIVGELRVNRIP